MMRALDQRDGQDPTCLPPDLLQSEVLSYLGMSTHHGLLPIKASNNFTLNKPSVHQKLPLSLLLSILGVNFFTPKLMKIQWSSLLFLGFLHLTSKLS
jgi:hypothetical protein